MFIDATRLYDHIINLSLGRSQLERFVHDLAAPKKSAAVALARESYRASRKRLIRESENVHRTYRYFGNIIGQYDDAMVMLRDALHASGTVDLNLLVSYVHTLELLNGYNHLQCKLPEELINALKALDGYVAGIALDADAEDQDPSIQDETESAPDDGVPLYEHVSALAHFKLELVTWLNELAVIHQCRTIPEYRSIITRHSDPDEFEMARHELLGCGIESPGHNFYTDVDLPELLDYAPQLTLVCDTLERGEDLPQLMPALRAAVQAMNLDDSALAFAH